LPGARSSDKPRKRPLVRDIDGVRPHGEKRQKIGIDLDRLHALFVRGKRLSPSSRKTFGISPTGIRTGNSPSTKELIGFSRLKRKPTVTFHSLRDGSAPSNGVLSGCLSPKGFAKMRWRR